MPAIYPVGQSGFILPLSLLETRNEVRTEYVLEVSSRDLFPSPPHWVVGLVRKSCMELRQEI